MPVDIYALNQAVTEAAVDAMTAGAGKAEKEIWDEIERLLAKLKTSGGNFDPDQTSAKLITMVKKATAQAIERSGFYPSIEKLFPNFDEIEENLRAYHAEANGIKWSATRMAAEKQWAIDATIFHMKDANVNLRYMDPVRKALFSRVNTGAGVVDTEKAIRAMILGAPDQAKPIGILNQWVGQTARDAVGQFEGGVNAQVAKDNDMDAWIYEGSIKGNSRPQCVRWVKQGIIKSERLPAEIAWAFNNGKGMIPATAPDNFSVYRGGYNCRHQAYPTFADDE